MIQRYIKAIPKLSLNGSSIRNSSFMGNIYHGCSASISKDSNLQMKISHNFCQSPKTSQTSSNDKIPVEAQQAFFKAAYSARYIQTIKAFQYPNLVDFKEHISKVKTLRQVLLQTQLKDELLNDYFIKTKLSEEVRISVKNQMRKIFDVKTGQNDPYLFSLLIQQRMINGMNIINEKKYFTFNPTVSVTSKIFKIIPQKFKFIIGGYGTGKTSSLILRCFLSGRINGIFYHLDKLNPEFQTLKTITQQMLKNLQPFKEKHIYVTLGQPLINFESTKYRMYKKETLLQVIMRTKQILSSSHFITILKAQCPQAASKLKQVQNTQKNFFDLVKSIRNILFKYYPSQICLVIDQYNIYISLLRKIKHQLQLEKDTQIINLLKDLMIVYKKYLEKWIYFSKKNGEKEFRVIFNSQGNIEQSLIFENNAFSKYYYHDKNQFTGNQLVNIDLEYSLLPFQIKYSIPDEFRKTYEKEKNQAEFIIQKLAKFQEIDKQSQEYNHLKSFFLGSKTICSEDLFIKFLQCSNVDGRIIKWAKEHINFVEKAIQINLFENGFLNNFKKVQQLEKQSQFQLTHHLIFEVQRLYPQYLRARLQILNYFYANTTSISWPACTKFIHIHNYFQFWQSLSKIAEKIPSLLIETKQQYLGKLNYLFRKQANDPFKTFLKQNMILQLCKRALLIKKNCLQNRDFPEHTDLVIEFDQKDKVGHFREYINHLYHRFISQLDNETITQEERILKIKDIDSIKDKYWNQSKYDKNLIKPIDHVDSLLFVFNIFKMRISFFPADKEQYGKLFQSQVVAQIQTILNQLSEKLKSKSENQTNKFDQKYFSSVIDKNIFTKIQDSGRSKLRCHIPYSVFIENQDTFTFIQSSTNYPYARTKISNALKGSIVKRYKL